MAMNRRRFIKATGVTAAAGMTGLAGCMGGGNGNGGDGNGGSSGGGSGSGDGGGSKPSFDGWLSNTSNYNGVVDKTGQSEVTVMVGAQGNGGNYAYDPAAIRVSPGTKVVWDWTGKGQAHNVVAAEGAGVQLMESSNLKSSGSFTYSHTFESAGTYKYFCVPHRSLGMKGVVVVEGSDDGEGNSNSNSNGNGNGNTTQ
ncbi:MAG: halocyanin domain-containing protein [Halobacteria archaeon]|nr:halocyanin domain-containing protein [Halobacteria archaeon]